MFEDNPICSMMGVVDDNSNNADHKFMFGNDKSRMEENHSMNMMFRQQNSNPYGTMFQGTPKKLEISQNHVIDSNNEHSNISAIFAGLDSNTFHKRLFQNDKVNENSQFGPVSFKKTNTPKKNIEDKKEEVDINLTPELAPQQFLQPIHEPKVIAEPECKINEDIPFTLNKNVQEEWSLPHPMDLFGPRSKFHLSNSNFGAKSNDEENGSINKPIMKKKDKKKLKRKRHKEKSSIGININQMYPMGYPMGYQPGYPMGNSMINDMNFGYDPLNQMNTIICQNNTPAVNPYFHYLLDVMGKRKSKKKSRYQLS